MEIGVVVVVVLEDCHHLVVPDNRFLHSVDAAMFVDDDACSGADSEGISHFSGVCTPIAHVVEFFSQDFLDSFDCMACRFAISGTDGLDYVGNGHVLKSHWWRGNTVVDGVAHTVHYGQF